MGRETGRVIELLWDCESCGRKDVLARYRTCPSCGSPKTGTNRIGNDTESRVLSSEDRKLFTGKPDWKCEYCGRMNKSSAETCIGCGSSRSESTRNYFDIQQEERQESRQEKKSSVENNSGGNGGSSITQTITPVARPKIIEHRRQNSINKHLLKAGLAVAAVLLMLIALVYICIPKYHTLTVQSLSWNRSISIDIEKTFKESDWTMPSGARLLYTNNEIHHYDEVIDHYDTVTVTKYRDEVVGHYYTYEDNGDGTAREIEHDKHEKVPYQVTEQEPVYKRVPVWWTKYYYEIDRYVHSRNIETQGNGHTEYWGDVELANKEREGKRSETYTLTAINEKGKTDNYKADYSLWNTLQKGDTIEVNVGFLNHITLRENK